MLLSDGDFLQFGEDCAVEGVLYRCMLFRVAVENFSEECIIVKESVEDAVELKLDALWSKLMDSSKVNNEHVYDLMENYERGESQV